MGLLGISNIRPLSSIMGVSFIDLPNGVSQFIYPNDKIKTGSANTSLVFDFQASFGLYYGATIGLMCIVLLDFLMFCFRKSKGLLLVVLYGLLLRTIFSLTMSSFTTSLNTHGILMVALLSMVWLFLTPSTEKPLPYKQNKHKTINSPS